MKKIVILFIAGIIIAVLAKIISYGYTLSISNQIIDGEIDNQIRIIQLSDLHNVEFGKDNFRLIKKVKDQQPDIIIMSGDMLNSNDENTEIVTNLIESLVKIAPVYYGMGNHEYAYMSNFDNDLQKLFTDSGAIVVDNNYVDVDINGNQVRIGGYMGYYRIPWMITSSEESKQVQNSFFEDFEDTDRYKILVNHIPTTWLDWGYNDYPVDLVFSGHYHGGQWVLPIIGPVYAPYIGFNPPYAKGVFKGKYATCILSSGLGIEYAFIPRINNPPEIVVVDLQTKK